MYIGPAVRALLAILVLSASASASPKNIILMVADGAAFNSFHVASYYQHGQLGMQPYDAFAVQYQMTTYGLNMSSTPTLDMTPLLGYDPVKAFDTTPTGDSDYFAGYKYLKRNAVDSAASATALATGQMTYNNAINWSNMNAPLPTTIVDVVKQMGKGAGVVTSVPWSHATPAALGGARNISRNNYSSIANDMLASNLDVIMGAGHPQYTDSGYFYTGGNDYKYVGGQATWDNLKSGSLGGDNPWFLIETKQQFEQLASGGLDANRVVGTAQVATTLQQARSGDGKARPFEVYQNWNVPSLETMARGALNVLSKNESGFYLMIEGGAIDWAAHGNQTGRLIEEFIDFNNTVGMVVEWVGANGGWEENLVIVTSDHGNGLIFGAQSQTIPFRDVFGVRAGLVPAVRWHSTDHTNETVPLYAMGAGSELFHQYAYNLGGSFGMAIHSTDVFRVMQGAVVPEPSGLAVLGSTLAGTFLFAGRRRG